MRFSHCIFNLSRREIAALRLLINFNLSEAVNMKTFEHKQFTLNLNTSEIESKFNGDAVKLNESTIHPNVEDFELIGIEFLFKETSKKFVAEVSYKTKNVNGVWITKNASFQVNPDELNFSNQQQWDSMNILDNTVRFTLLNNKTILYFNPEDMLPVINANKDNGLGFVFSVRGAVYNATGMDLDIYGLDVFGELA